MAALAKKRSTKAGTKKKRSAAKATSAKKHAKKVVATKKRAKKAVVARKQVAPKPRGARRAATAKPAKSRKPRHPAASPRSGRPDGAAAFLPDPTAIGHRRVKDDLAEELGEEFVSGATSGESVDDERDAPVPEEDGGPFVTTSARSQYGSGPDASNPPDAEREPFPTTQGQRRR